MTPIPGARTKEKSCPHCCIWNENMRWPEGYAPRRTDMGDELTAPGKLRHRKCSTGTKKASARAAGAVAGLVIAFLRIVR